MECMLVLIIMSSEQNLQEKKPSTSARNGPTTRGPDEKIAAPNGGHAEHFESATSEVGASPISRNLDAELSVGEEEEGRTTGLQATSTNQSRERHGSQMSEQELQEHERQISHLRERVGLPEDPHILPEHESTNRFSWPSVRVIFREPLPEFFGTMVMVMFGNGSVAQVLLGGGEISAPGRNGYGSYQSIN